MLMPMPMLMMLALTLLLLLDAFKVVACVVDKDVDAEIKIPNDARHIAGTNVVPVLMLMVVMLAILSFFVLFLILKCLCL